MWRLTKILFQPRYRHKILCKLARNCKISFINEYTKELKLYEDIRLLYFETYGQYPDLHKPQTLDEKMLWLSLYWRNPIKAVCADKYKCRKYVTQHCGLPENLLVPLLGVWDNAEDINFEALPNQFVLKCNHGSGYNIIVKDKKKLNIEHAQKQLNQWLSEDFAGNISEIHYKDIKPHKIICEQYLPAIGDSSSVIDYKLVCFNGVPAFFFVAYDRDVDGGVTYCTFSLEWKQLFYINNEKKVSIPRPASCCDMIKYAQLLSKGFPFIRVDFYDLEGRPFLGELTFTPYGNLQTYFTPDVIAKYGKILQLPPKYKRKQCKTIQSLTFQTDSHQ